VYRVIVPNLGTKQVAWLTQSDWGWAWSMLIRFGPMTPLRQWRSKCVLEVTMEEA